MFQNDYIIKQIEMMTKFLAKLVFGKESPEYDVIFDAMGNTSDEGTLALKLRQMIDSGEINEADNLLFDTIGNGENVGYLEVALDFYSKLSDLDEKKLDECDFSRIEILEGLDNVKKIYGIEAP